MNLISNLRSFLTKPILWVLSLQINFMGNMPCGYDSNSADKSSSSYPSFLILNFMLDSHPNGTMGKISSRLSKYILG